MHIAVIGAGRMGRAHARTLSALGRVDTLTIADLSETRAAEVAAEVGAVPAGIDAVFRDRPDGVVIVTPTSTHADLIVRAVEAGIAVFCEKPVAEDLEQTRRVVTLVEEHDVPVQIGFQRRFDPGYERAKAELESGALGELRRVHMVTCDPRPPAAEYIPTSGGIFRDCNIHDFDALRWVTGREVETVFAAGVNRGASFFGESGDVDEATIVAVLDDGTLATVQSSRYNGAGYDARMELAGTDAQITAGLDERVPLRSAEADVTFPAGTPWPDFQTRFQAAYSRELTRFVRVAARETGSPCTPRDALHALAVAEAADLSRRQGRPVRVAEISTSTTAPPRDRHRRLTLDTTGGSR